jgi:class 3 adenylate cyclase
MMLADLESSALLGRRLSTHAYFPLVRRLTFRADRSVVERGGIIGKHAGDGTTAFFLAESAESESAAARACIESARALRTDAALAAERSQIDANEVLRMGLIGARAPTSVAS